MTDSGLAPDKSKVEAITSMPIPEDKKAVQYFVGMCNFLSQFLPRLSKVCATLHEVSTPQGDFCWSSTQQAAFDKIEGMITSAPLLQFFDPTLPVTVQVDASEKGLGASLLQKHRPIAYTSSAMNKSECDGYAQIEKECLTIVNAETQDQWLYGHKNILTETHHKSLETIFK